LVVHADEQASWRPDNYEYGRWGGRTRIDFLAAKLLDYRGREEELTGERNPFAQVVLAHLQALAMREDASARQRYKVRLVKGLYDRGWTAEDVRQLFRLIDWMMDLPPELQQGFRDEIANWEEERRMPYVTSIERLAIAEGIEKGRLEARQEDIAAALGTKFGAAGKRLTSKIHKITDLRQLRKLFQTVLKAENLAEVRQVMERSGLSP
jgi:hypothetical protein